jgi:hypothetical protein
MLHLKNESFREEVVVHPQQLQEPEEKEGMEAE